MRSPRDGRSDGHRGGHDAVKPADWLRRFEARRERLAADLEFLVTHESPSEDFERVSSLAREIGDRRISADVPIAPPASTTSWAWSRYVPGSHSDS